MTNKTGMYWKKLSKESKKIQCQLCPWYCIIENGELGNCDVRMNQNKELKSLVYGKPCIIHLDPIEKKPLYHVLPGQESLSIATIGCNLHCKHCQNDDISQPSEALIDNLDNIKKISPEKIIEQVKENNSCMISYTYTEPAIFYEYMLDIAKLAKKESIKNTSVTNGYINQEPLKELCKYLDASNIDLKSINDDFYKNICGVKAGLKPVLKTIKTMQEKGVWIEITNLIIPGLNDSMQDIIRLISWIRNNLGVDVPLHFSAFSPCYKLSNLPHTQPEILKKARKTAINAGLNYVYTGNINDDKGNSTYCPNCKKPVIKRKGYYIAENKIKEGKCPCGEKIPGVWQ